MPCDMGMGERETPRIHTKWLQNNNKERRGPSSCLIEHTDEVYLQDSVTQEVTTLRPE